MIENDRKSSIVIELIFQCKAELCLFDALDWGTFYLANE